jgi:hypothetical protein
MMLNHCSGSRRQLVFCFRVCNAPKHMHLWSAKFKP